MHDLDGILAEMYDSISFEPGRRPDWGRQTGIFAPGARMVRITDDGVFEFTLDSYRETIDRLIDSGKFASFWEAEIWRETRQFGELAHVLSAYESRTSLHGEFLGRGVNSIQLFRQNGRWWISAMLWRRDGKSVQIPERP